MFGPRAVGKEEAGRLAKIRTDGAGGGAIQFGPRVTNPASNSGINRGPRLRVVVPVVPVGGKPAAPGNVPKPLTGAAKLAADKRAERLATAERDRLNALLNSDAPTFTEAEVAHMLASDPSTWAAILRAEGVRPEGPRPAVAAMILDIAGQVDGGIPEPITAELETIAAITLDPAE